MTAVLFDLDDTLVTLSGGPLPAALAAARTLCCAETGVAPAAYDQANAAVRTRLFADLEAGRLPWVEVRLRLYAETLEALGHPDPDLARRAALRMGDVQLAAQQLYADVLPTLNRLRMAAIPIGIVTNGGADDHPESQRSKIRHFGLEPLVDMILISDEVGVRKPRPALFHLALERLGLKPGPSVLYVGDSLSADVAGANAAGLTSVWLNRSGAPLPEGAATPALTISTLAEVPGLLPWYNGEDVQPEGICHEPALCPGRRPCAHDLPRHGDRPRRK